jgi:FHA domain-containing protein
VSTIEKLVASLRRLFEGAPRSQPQEDPAPAAAPARLASAAVPEPIPAPIAVAAEAAELVEELPSSPPGPSVEVADAIDAVEAESTAVTGVGLVLRLETERGPAPTFEVARSGATIGRGPENTIRLEDLSVSRRHARIAYRQGAYWLSDLGSMGGTWVDGTKLNAARRVAAGQMIDIGVCRLIVAAAGDAAADDQDLMRSRRAVPPAHRRSS